MADSNPMLEQLIKNQTAATLTASIVSAMGRPVSMAEVQSIFRDVSFTFHPQPGSGHHQQWAKSFDGTKKYE